MNANLADDVLQRAIITGVRQAMLFAKTTNLEKIISKKNPLSRKGLKCQNANSIHDRMSIG